MVGVGDALGVCERERVPLLSAADLCGRVFVLDLTNAPQCIEAVHLRELRIEPGDHIVLRTTNTTRHFGAAPSLPHAYLDPSAAELLAQREVAVLGFDHYSVDQSATKLAAHRLLAGRNIPVVVMLDLRDVAAGEYFWVVAPLRLRGLEASPARVLFFPTGEEKRD